MVDLSRIMQILSMMPVKRQKTVMSVVNFSDKAPGEVLLDIINAMIAAGVSQKDRDILSVYKSVPIPDEAILNTFGELQTERREKLSFTEEQLEYIQTNVYRNMNGKFRIVPNSSNISIDNLPLDGLDCDDEILSAKLMNSRRTEVGSLEVFDGLKAMRQQHYEGPYKGIFQALTPNLQRIRIVSSFEASDPPGFYRRGEYLYRNVCHRMSLLDPGRVKAESLRRSMLLMYLVSGANINNWRTLYALIHFMVHCPNSSTGYILYLNDFDAGGNGKSKFVSVLQHIFGEAFTAFEPHQLRFNISLMGKRLVHISEYEDSETSKQLQGMLKAMTGRDKFQYEGKGMDPIVADTYQNFIISSNKYIYFEDAGIKRRLQNFHCSNLLHLLLAKHYHSHSYLNPLFGNPNTNSREIALEMAHSLYDYILKDKNQYDIKLRPQDFVLGNLKNPILRALFRDNLDTDGFIADWDDGCRLDLFRLHEDPKPEQFNYAMSTIVNWLIDANLQSSRDATFATSPMPKEVFVKYFNSRLQELNKFSVHLKNKNKVYCEYGNLNDFNSKDLLKEFFFPGFNENNIPYETTSEGLLVC